MHSPLPSYLIRNGKSDIFFAIHCISKESSETVLWERKPRAKICCSRGNCWLFRVSLAAFHTAERRSTQQRSALFESRSLPSAGLGVQCPADLPRVRWCDGLCSAVVKLDGRLPASQWLVGSRRGGGGVRTRRHEWSSAVWIRVSVTSPARRGWNCATSRPCVSGRAHYCPLSRSGYT